METYKLCSICRRWNLMDFINTWCLQILMWRCSWLWTRGSGRKGKRPLKRKRWILTTTSPLPSTCHLNKSRWVWADTTQILTDYLIAPLRETNQVNYGSMYYTEFISPNCWPNMVSPVSVTSHTPVWLYKVSQFTLSSVPLPPANSRHQIFLYAFISLDHLLTCLASYPEPPHLFPGH